MKASLKDQLAALQKSQELPEYKHRKRDFPILARRDIRRGAIIYVSLSEEEGLYLSGYDEKDKWIVVIGVTDDGFLIGSLLINTAPAMFSKEQGDVQFPMKQSDYRFLDYDSWLDCSQLFHVPISKVLKSGGFCGRISVADWSLIREVLCNSIFLTAEEKEMYGLIEECAE